MKALKLFLFIPLFLSIQACCFQQDCYFGSIESVNLSIVDEFGHDYFFGPNANHSLDDFTMFTISGENKVVVPVFIAATEVDTFFLLSSASNSDLFLKFGQDVDTLLTTGRTIDSKCCGSSTIVENIQYRDQNYAIGSNNNLMIIKKKF